MARRIGRRAVIASGAVGLTGLSGCLGILDGGGGGPPGSDGGGASVGWPVKLGVLAPQSGSLASLGEEVVSAAELVKRQVDVSVNDFTVELTVKDTESSPDVAVSAAQELVDSGHQMIVGPGSGEEAGAVTTEVLTGEGVTAVSPLAATGLVDVQDDDLLFSTAPRANNLALGMSRPIAIARTESVSILATDNDYGNSIGQRMKEEITTRGISVQADLRISDLDADSYTSTLEEALADDPGSLVIAADPEVGIQLLKDFYANFESKPVFLTDRLRIPRIPSEVESNMENAQVVSLKPRWARPASASPDVGNASNGTNGTGGGAQTRTATGEDADLLTTFRSAFRTAFEREPTIQAAQAFDAAATLTLAAVRVGQDNYDGAAISDALRKVSNDQNSYSGVRGFGYDDYWEGLQLISEGVRNNYQGAASGVQYDPETGQLVRPLLHAARFAPDTETGFEEIIPIPI